MSRFCPELSSVRRPVKNKNIQPHQHTCFIRTWGLCRYSNGGGKSFFIRYPNKRNRLRVIRVRISLEIYVSLCTGFCVVHGYRTRRATLQYCLPRWNRDDPARFSFAQSKFVASDWGEAGTGMKSSKVFTLYRTVFVPRRMYVIELLRKYFNTNFWILFPDCFCFPENNLVVIIAFNTRYETYEYLRSISKRTLLIKFCDVQKLKFKNKQNMNRTKHFEKKNNNQLIEYTPSM